jgi:transcriptional regulator with XRE-family HTH domain
MAVNIEDAGFEIRDMIAWVYGQGFPKSLDVSKAIDSAGGASPAEQARVLKAKRTSAGMTREVLADAVGCTTSSVRDWEEGRARAVGATVEHIIPSRAYRSRLADILGYTKDERKIAGVSVDRRGDGTVYGVGHAGVLREGGNTDAAKQWQGWGTALKPALEPITMARKPLDGCTVAENVLRHGTGAINIDGARVEAPEGITNGGNYTIKHAENANGEWGMKAQGRATPHNLGRFPANFIHDGSEEVTGLFPGEDGKNAARFFYCAKASASERGKNNGHPTVKPLALVRYLCRLITPPNGTILDPFAGSGTMGVAAEAEGFNSILIEKEQRWLEVARNRIAQVAPLYSEVTT